MGDDAAIIEQNVRENFAQTRHEVQLGARGFAWLNVGLGVIWVVVALQLLSATAHSARRRALRGSRGRPQGRPSPPGSNRN